MYMMVTTELWSKLLKKKKNYTPKHRQDTLISEYPVEHILQYLEVS